MTVQPPFTPTAAVASARQRAQYIACPACGGQAQTYLMHSAGARFVRCRLCRLVYADPVAPTIRPYFDIQAQGQHDRLVDQRNVAADFEDMVRSVAVAGEARPREPGGRLRIALLGRWHPLFPLAVADLAEVDPTPLEVRHDARLLNIPLVDTIGHSVESADIVLLNEFLEALQDPSVVLRGLAERLHPHATVAVTFANMHALPSRVLRRRWKDFFSQRIAFYDANNLELLMWRCGFERVNGRRLHATYSLGYLTRRLELPPPLQRGISSLGCDRLSARGPSGRELILFKPLRANAVERLSIIVPVLNERAYLRAVLQGLVTKRLSIGKEIIVIDSGSTDGSRDVISSFASDPGVRVILQDRARGKGHAVRTGIRRATGSIIMIQDADFEYDLDDYEALLDPILRRRASFVIGSRTLGIDDWKVRRYGDTPVKGVLLNLAQVAFARSFNALYQQKTTDINSMFKVFRRECINGVSLTGNGFDFDIELVCKIVRNGFEPFEVPVNYRARGFKEGKKIRFLRDAFPSYYQLFRCRFGTR